MLKVAVLVSGGGTNLQAIWMPLTEGTITNAEVSGHQQQYKCLRAGESEKAGD